MVLASSTVPARGDRPIPRRRSFRPRRNNRPEHRVNRRIRFPQIRVIDPDGEMLGIMSPDEGRAKAREHGLDLVEVAPKARPPVCRIMDYGKFRYERSKRQNSNKSNQKTLKTFKMRPTISDHDLDTKLRKAFKNLRKGNPIRLVMRLRGRERAVTGRWVKRMRNIIARIRDEASVDIQMVQAPRAEGRLVSAQLEPLSN